MRPAAFPHPRFRRILALTTLGALAAATPTFAQLAPWFDFGDWCIPSPEDGIFCGEDPGGGTPSPLYAGPFSLATLASNATQTWDTSFTSGPLPYRYTLNSGVTLSVNGDPVTAGRFNGTIEGNGTLHFTGGNLRLGYNNYHTGGTIVSGGRLVYTDRGALGEGTTELRGGTLAGPGVYKLAVTGNGVLEIPEGTSSTIGALTGSATLTKTGAGGLSLINSNIAFTGDIHVLAGSLTVDTPTGLSAASANVTMEAGTRLKLLGSYTNTDGPSHFSQSLTLPGGAVQVQVDYTPNLYYPMWHVHWDGVVSGTGKLVKIGAGNLHLDGTNTYTGGTLVSEGILTAKTNASLGADGTGIELAAGAALGLGNGFFSDSRVLTLNSGTEKIEVEVGAATWGGLVTGPGALEKTGAGTLTLSGSNNHTGGTIVGMGTLSVASAAPLGSGPLTVNGTLQLGDFAFSSSDLSGNGTISLINTFTLNPTGNSGYTGGFAGTGSLLYTGSGVYTMARSSTLSGATRILNGTLRLGVANGLSASSSLFINNGATVQLAGYNQTVGDLDSYNPTTGNYYDTGTVDLGGATLTNLNRVQNNWGGTITGSGTVIKQGAALMNWAGTNDFSGLLRVDAGKIRTLAINSLSPNARIDLAAGTALELNSFSQAIGGLSGSGTVTLGSANLTTGGAANTTFSGTINGTGALIKTGAGTLTLSNSNTYSGGTTINGGRISIGNDAALGAASTGLTLNGGGLNITATSFTLSRAITLGGSGMSAIKTDGTLTISSAMTGSGSFTKDGAGTLILTGANVLSGGTTVAEGTLRSGSNQALGLGALAVNGRLELDGHTQGVSSLTGSGTIDVSGGGLSVSQSSAVHIFAGSIVGSGSLGKYGNGFMVLSGINTYSGGTTIGGGAIEIFSGASLGASSGTVTIQDGASLKLRHSGISLPHNIYIAGGIIAGEAATTLSGIISGSGELRLAGPASFTLSGANTHTGGIRLENVDVTVAADQNLGAPLNPLYTTRSSLIVPDGFSTARSITTGDAFSLNTAGSATFSGLINGPGGLTKTGAGTLVLTNTNAFAGGFTTEAGTARGGAPQAFGSGPLAVASGAKIDLAGYTQTSTALSGTGELELGASTLTLNQSANSTFSGVISGAGSLVKAGSGTLTLSGSNSYSGGTIVNGGVLAISADANLGAASGSVTLGNATLQVTGPALDRSLILTGAASLQPVGDVTLGGIVSGTGSLTKTGAGTLTLAAANTHSGGTAVSQGTLAISSDHNLGASSRGVSVSNATLAFTGTTASSRTIAFSGITTLRIDAAVILSDSLTGEGTLTKAGAGTLTLTGANSFSGAILLQTGRLHLTGSLAGIISVRSGATLSGAGSLGGLAIAGALAPGNSTGSLSASSAIFAPGGSYAWEINDVLGAAGASNGWDLLSISGALTITATAGNRFTLNVASLAGIVPGLAASFDPTQSYSFDFVTAAGGITGFDTSAFSINTSGFANTFSGAWSVTSSGNALALSYAAASAIPEPSTYAASAGILALLLAWRRRRR